MKLYIKTINMFANLAYLNDKLRDTQMPTSKTIRNKHFIQYVECHQN